MAAVNRFSRINLTIQQLCLTVCTRGTIILWRRVCFHVGGDLGFCLIVTSVWQRRMCACVSLYPCYWVFGWRSCACANKRNVFRLTLNSFTLLYIYIFYSFYWMRIFFCQFPISHIYKVHFPTLSILHYPYSDNNLIRTVDEGFRNRSNRKKHPRAPANDSRWLSRYLGIILISRIIFFIKSFTTIF